MVRRQEMTSVIINVVSLLFKIIIFIDNYKIVAGLDISDMVRNKSQYITRNQKQVEDNPCTKAGRFASTVCCGNNSFLKRHYVCHMP